MREGTDSSQLYALVLLGDAGLPGLNGLPGPSGMKG